MNNLRIITIATLFAGRFYALEAYFHGIMNIAYPRDLVNLVFLTNSDSKNFKKLLEISAKELQKEFRSVRIYTSGSIPPSANAFIENGKHTREHARVIAGLYNELYEVIPTEQFIFIEDDIIAPENAILGLVKCWNEGVGYVCGVQMDRHKHQMFIWGLEKKRVYPEGDSCNEMTYWAKPMRNPWGIRDIGLGHFGLTLLDKKVCEQLSKPIFKPNLDIAGALVGCDMVMCVELEKLGLRKICNFDVRAHHMDSKGRIH